MRPFHIGILGNVNDNYEPHYTMNKVFTERQAHVPFQYRWIPTETLEQDAPDTLRPFQGIVAGSGPYRSKTGVINGIRYARENNIPFLGTCSGFGYAVLEFGQTLFHLGTITHLNEGIPIPAAETFLQPLNVCSMDNHPICFQPVPATLTSRVYNHPKTICETTHCSYGINTRMIDAFREAGLIVSAHDEEGEAKIMEYRPNDFFLIVLFLPQFQSTPNQPHPLITAFLNAAATRKLTANTSHS